MSDRARLERRDDAIIVTLVGEIDLSNVTGIEAEINAAIDDEHRIVVDLGRTEYLDSAGARMLFSLARLARGRMRIVVPDASPMRRVLEIVGLPAVVPIVASIDAATA